ncbi:MAG TPA: carbohydrate porin [Terriglobales bacterium]|nr:carbohydrate porin [Terriglobales bacterium]
MHLRLAILAALAVAAHPQMAADPALVWHFQSTALAQGNAPFAAAYTGPNSFPPDAEVRETVSADAMADARLGANGTIHVDLLIWQGYGLGNTTGAAGFPNGEAFRVGKTYPDAALVRAFLKETLTSGGRKITFTVGHFSPLDVFDTNTYAGDPRTQFMNWSLMANAAWDYPANSIGFTNGAAAEISFGPWTARAGLFQVSEVANGMRLDWHLLHAHSEVAELERQYAPGRHAGALRLLAYDTEAPMGGYQQTINHPALNQNIGLTAANRFKYGFGVNGEQELAKNIAAFWRLGWNDGKNQSYEFTDVDRTATGGLSLNGGAWRRQSDALGLALAVNAISAVHEQYLARGGLGITVGDGALAYRPEKIVETYYRLQAAKHYQFTLDYQLIADPAYNHARGPVHILALRWHTEY